MNTWRAKQITDKLPNFKKWLASNGAQVLEPTNEWELARFKAGDATAVIYRDKMGNATFTGDAGQAWECFKSGGSWRAIPKTKRRSGRSDRVMMRAVRARDGDLCFFCLQTVSEEQESLEHLVAVTHGGPNHISNIYLAHRTPCNSAAGHLSAIEKIKLHVEAHLKRLEVKQ